MVERIPKRIFLFLGICLYISSFGTAFRTTLECKNARKRLCMQGEGPLNRGEVEEIETKSRTALFAEKIKFKNFEQVLDCFHGEPIIIYFSTVHCGPCQLMKKELKQVQTQLGEDMKMFNVDTEKWPKIASRLQVATLPCLVVFREGEIKLRLEGVTSADSIIEHLDSFL